MVCVCGRRTAWLCGVDGCGDVVAQVKSYFLESDSFEETFLGWAKRNAHRINLSTDENLLEYVPV